MLPSQLVSSEQSWTYFRDEDVTLLGRRHQTHTSRNLPNSLSQDIEAFWEMVSSFVSNDIDYNVLANQFAAWTVSPLCVINNLNAVRLLLKFPREAEKRRKVGDSQSNSWKNSIMTALLLIPTQLIFSTCNETYIITRKITSKRVILE